MVRFYTTVRRGVRDQTFSMSERSVALITLVGFLAGVHSYVHFELTLVQEAGATIVAQMTLFSHVLDHVDVQRRLGQIERIAFATFVLLLRSAI